MVPFKVENHIAFCESRASGVSTDLMCSCSLIQVVSSKPQVAKTVNRNNDVFAMKTLAGLRVRAPLALVFFNCSRASLVTENSGELHHKS